MPGLRDAKCLCKKCRDERASQESKKMTSEDFIEAVRLRYLARRKYILIEQEEKYCEITAMRLEAENKQLKMF